MPLTAVVVDRQIVSSTRREAGLGEARGPSDGNLVLLVDYDSESRRQARHVFELRGMDVVQASNGMAALELIQRLPQSFRLVLTDLDLPGIPGAVVVETLRIFRPDLPVLCMSDTRTVAGRLEVKQCLSKPLQGGELEAMLEESASGWELRGLLEISDQLAARVRARFAVGGDLVEAALELFRGVDPDE
jgi:CheY-like chemotaxis protein